MTSTTLAQPVNPIRERQVIAGSLSQSTGVYSITLDGGEVVTTTDPAVAKVAAAARDQSRAIVVDLEARPGQPSAILELTLAPKAVAAAVAVPAVSAPKPQALTTAPALPTGLIHSPEKLTEQLTRLQSHYHVLSPAIAVADMAPGYGANLALVKIDPSVVMAGDNGVGPDCYFSKNTHKDAGKRSLNKQGIVKIGQASGVQWDPRLCRRTDDNSERNYWAWEYVGYVRTHDGQVLTIKGSRELDLRDGSGEAIGMPPGMLKQQRAMGNELCETKAMLRALRTLGIRAAYTVEELQKPFLIVRFSFTPDMADPEIKKLVTERAMGGIGALYLPPLVEAAAPPPTTAPALPAAGKVDPFAAGAAEPSLTASASKTAERPLGAHKVTDVQTFNGIGKPKDGKPGRPYAKTTVAFDSGDAGVTFSSTLAELATRAKAAGQWVKPTLEENPQYPDQLNLSALEVLDGTQPDLAGIAEDNL